ncbi:MAG: 2-oxo acid dehydrogenase subunit E2 [Cyclobacteriaceae bacterium]
MNSTLPKHISIPFSLERKQIVDFLRIGKSKHTAYAVMDFDITGIRENMRKARRVAKRHSSLTGYLLYCFAQAVAEDKIMHAYRKGNKLVIFDDVDVATMVERNVNGVPMPVGYILRRANYKSVFDISEEIKSAKSRSSTDLIDSKEMLQKKRLNAVIKRVGFLRRWALAYIFKNPFIKKKFNGTVGFSSMGMFSHNLTGWIVPITPHVLTAMVGGIRDVPAFKNDILVKKEMVCITIAMDHDILDGAQTARFIERFRKLLIQGVDFESKTNDAEKV